ncbi:tRNA (cytidine(34)-2'-O)-methyltransferase [Litorimonas sp. RW-G-Af-16]|uniref:tRNA (cytidine(34)-2'-O)-methyltransferase n=1 Tax=Litorimonas sp. RW-G-Af-16 TaxID=3241168 RepID=UPI00390C733D
MTSSSLNVTLFQPDIAANLGAIMRSCACFDVALSVIEPCGFPLTEKSLRRAAMDYGTPTALTRHVSWDAFKALPRTGRRVLLTTKGATSLADFIFEPSDTLIFGRESAGVPDDVHAAMDARVVIPMAAGARSLNLSNSVAVTLFEALRQTQSLP